MESKKVNIEDLFEELRSLSENYEVDEIDSDIFILTNSDINAFSEDVLRIVKKFIKNELTQIEEDVEADLDTDEDGDDFLFLDMYDEEDLD